MDNSENTKRVAKNTFFLFLRMIIVMCVGLYTSRVVLRTLGIEDYGVYNVIGSVVVLFSFLQSALTNATYRFLAYDLGLNDKERLKKTFSMSINTHWILAVIIFILSETVGLWFLNTKIVLPDGRLFAANWAYQFAIFSFVVMRSGLLVFLSIIGMQTIVNVASIYPITWGIAAALYTVVWYKCKKVYKRRVGVKII